MSYVGLLTPEREEFTWKNYNEMFDIAFSAFPIVSTRGIQKEYFLHLVNENEQLFENEKRYCRDYFIYNFELKNEIYKQGKPSKCENCKLTRYSSRFCENCIRQRLQNLFNSWTSGNDIVDNFIQQCQVQSSLPTQIIEWIPCDQFRDVKNLAKGGFSTVYTAI